MQKLEPPATHYLNAACGWLDLGNVHEAQMELDRIAASLCTHPEVLAMQWEIHARAREWERSLDTACLLLNLNPNDPGNWVKRSYSLHELKRTDEAMKGLSDARERFPKMSIIPYNLACYACQLGRTDEARRLLHEAAGIGGRDQIKSMALKDPDLTPLRHEIASW